MIVEKNSFGYYSVINMPNKEDLKYFYANKYFQNDGIRYNHTYSEDELIFMENKAKIADHILNKINNKTKKSILDVGSGEGFFAKYFFKQSNDVKTLDFSSFAIAHHNPELISTLQQGDIFNSLDDALKNQEKYDLINLSNVLDHVIDPIELLKKLKLLLKNN
ncbi:MAG: methyltransferase domain-containing protein, partial [Campylobacterales bacterium]|nr:methyltransferase domain-containing protein [Campylobacterales bacterium]